MSTSNCQKPRLPSHYYVLYEPPDSAGEEVLHFISECRKIKVKGHSFREFQQHVIPLLDGRHTLEEIQAELADLFRPQDLTACLQLLAEQNLLEDAQESPFPADMDARLQPQLNFFHEVSSDAYQTQLRLAESTVALVGTGGAGAHAAMSLAAANVGSLRCIDSGRVAPADTYLAPIFSAYDIGGHRAEAVRRKVGEFAPNIKAATDQRSLETDAEVLAAVEGSDFVICCVDPAQSSLIYKLNRACLRAGIPWTSCSTSGLEVVVGPTVYPFETACYLCYKMRLVACAENPEDEFAYQRFLDGRKKDDSGQRENLVFAAALAGNLLALEAIKQLAGFAQPSARGRILVIDLLDFQMEKHVVLRKPWCPACFGDQPGSGESPMGKGASE